MGLCAGYSARAWAFRLLLLVLIASAVLSLSVKPAAAITLYFNESPARDQVVTISNPVISVKISDPAGLYSTVTMKVDNKTLSTKYSFATQIAKAQATGLANGVHNVYVSALSYTGQRTSYTWSFSVGVPPSLSSPQPMPASTVNLLRPDIRATAIAAPGASITATAMRIDGVAVSSSYDPVTKTVAWAKDRDLSDETAHSVSLTVSDAAGTSATLDWSFRVNRYEDMPAVTCVTCHPGEPLAHDTESPDSCYMCHNEPDYSGTGVTSPIGDCVACHYWVHGPDRLLSYQCEYCHASRWSDRVDSHDTSPDTYHQTTTDMSGCACHSKALTREHFRRTDDAGSPLNCETCHSAAAPAAVQAAVQSGARDCDACHTAGSHAADHSLARTDACADCHAGDGLLAVHLSGSGLTCNTCHSSTDPEVVAAIAAKSLACSGCHTEQGVDYHLGFQVLHVSPTDACTGAGCHAETRLVETHAPYVGPTGRYPAYADTCALCHLNTDLVRVPEGATAECADCHPDRVVFHGYEAAMHTAALGSGWITVFDDDHDYPDQGAAGAYKACGSCHNAELGPVHAGVCGTCHPTPRDSFATWNDSCSTGGCHATYHAASGWSHWDALGDCNTCHNSGWDPYTVDCTGCHAVPSVGDTTPPVTTSDARASYVGAAVITFKVTDSGKVAIGTTLRRLDGGTVSTGDLLTVAEPGEHTLEYWSVDQFGNVEATPHTVTFTVSADTVPPLTTSNAKAAYEGGAAITLAATDASTFGVKATYYKINSGATQTGTYVTIPQPASGTLSYTLTFWSEDWAGNVETPNAVSFTVRRDVTPPVSTLGAQPYYKTASISIPFSAVDTGVGVATKYYKVDGGTQQTAWGSSVYRTYTQGPHTIEYWSVDYNGNSEIHRVATFVVDWTAPTVASDAVASYPESGASITITASDLPANGASPPAVKYRLDGGAMMTGPAVTTVSVTAAGTHSIEFWAEDLAGNAGAHTTTIFTVGSGGGGVGLIRLVWGNSDNQIYYPSAGSYASWTIRLGGPAGTVIDTGHRDGGTDWNGVDDIIVPVSATPYYVYVDWWDEDWYSEGPSIFPSVSVTYGGQIARLSY